MTGRLFCFGLGYCATTLSRALLSEGWTIGGTTRQAEKRAALRDLGIDAHLFSSHHPVTDPNVALANTSHLLISSAPDEVDDPVLTCHLTDLLAVRTIKWVGYLSTTGVYGDREGGWVSEADECAPTSARAKRRVAAEQQWLASGLPVHIFRLAAIYGPGPDRNALADVRAGRARRVVKPNQVFSRIHVQDIARVLRASINRPNPGAIYNVADDEPAPPQDVVAYAAKLLGVEPPPEIPIEKAALSEAARGFYADNRRVANGRIKSEFGVKFAYPSYREGLKAIVDEGII